MQFEHFGGSCICNTPEEADAVLGIVFGKGVNEFWIYEGGFPYLAIMVNQDLASIFYVPNDTSAGYQALNEQPSLDVKEFTTFYTNTEAEEIRVSNKFVLPKNMITKVVHEFMNCKDLPNSIKWFEL